MFGLTPQGRGQQAEKVARKYLQGQGLSLVEKNYRCRVGELDLIMRHHEALVFVEVKYRSGVQYGYTSEAVDRHKQQKIIRSAQHFLQQHPQYANLPCRFDVVSITGTEAEIEWLQGAFDSG